jgi:superoxide dismutase
MEAIKRDFGSFEKMKATMSAATVAVQGSGWGWLGYNITTDRLHIAACPNQDPLQATTGKVVTHSRYSIKRFSAHLQILLEHHTNQRKK